MSTGVDRQHNQDSGRNFGPFSSSRKLSRLRSASNCTSTSRSDTGLKGQSNTTMAQSQRSRYIKTAAIVGLMVMLVLWLSPPRPTVRKFQEARPLSSSAAESTCSKPFDPSKPLKQYVLMIDAGSTGSRIHVYRFNNCGPTPTLENERFEQTKPKPGGAGLSSYGDDAEGAARSLDPLMEVAMQEVPDEYKRCTPVAVKATAGLRLLGPEKSEKILEAVRHRLETAYPFPVVSREEDGVVIMDGSDEGVYAWITANYLLGKIGGSNETPTAAILDLGGGSTQIVFEPTFPGSATGGMPEKLAEGDHKYNLTFGGRDFELYQHSHLGYGLMAAREAIHKLIVESKLALSPYNLTWLNEPILNPCIGPGMQKDVTLSFSDGHALGSQVTVTMLGPMEASAAAQCRGLAERILKKDAECSLTPCSFNGVHQPSLEKTFSTEDVYIFSYFYDRTYPLGMPSSFTLDELHQLTAHVCGGGERWKLFEGVDGALEELQGRPEWCLDLNFMLSLLHTGYEMPMSREVKIAKKIKNNELGWCLGASLPLLSQGSGWTCRIEEVS